MLSPWQIALSGSFENKETIGFVKTVNGIAWLTAQVFEIPVTETTFPLAKVDVANVVVAEAAP